MISTITRAQALEVLTEGLERCENYMHANLTEDTLDDLWNINLYLKPAHNEGPLGTYHCGKNMIHVYNHVRGIKHYDAADTILHELAHHIMWICYRAQERTQGAHGAKWRWVCQVLGANPRASQRGIAVLDD
jgi:hypothetical protein